MTTLSISSIYIPVEEGKSFWVGPEFITLKIRGNDTQEAYALSEVTTLPQGGLPPHIHMEHDEAYYILEGEYFFQDITNDKSYRAIPGSFINISRGTVHAYQNVGSSKGKYLLIHTPAGLEGFFEELGMPSLDKNNPPSEGFSEEQLHKVAQKYSTRPG